MYTAFRSGKGTRDMAGPEGLTTEQFVDAVAEDLKWRLESKDGPRPQAFADFSYRPKHLFL